MSCVARYSTGSQAKVNRSWVSISNATGTRRNFNWKMCTRFCPLTDPHESAAFYCAKYTTTVLLLYRLKCFYLVCMHVEIYVFCSVWFFVVDERIYFVEADRNGQSLWVVRIAPVFMSDTFEAWICHYTAVVYLRELHRFTSEVNIIARHSLHSPRITTEG